MNFKTHFAKNIKLAYPVMLSQAGHVFVGLADNIMVGRVNVESLAASSLGNSIFYFAFVFGIGVSYAITPLVAKADISNNYHESASMLKHALIINLITGLILFIATIIFTKFIFLLDQPSEVEALAIPYLYIIGASILPFMLFQTFRQFCEGLSMTKVPMYITIIANVINIVLNYILIFGKLGFPAMGLFGAGLATLISRILMGIGIFIFIRYSSKFIKYWEYFKQIKVSYGPIKTLVNIGIPAGLQFVFEVGTFAFAAIMAGWLGTLPLAAHQIAINLCSISYMMATGLSSAATIRVGNQMGESNIKMVIDVGKSCFVMAIVFMMLWAAIFVLGKSYLPAFYVDERAVIEIASSLLVIAGFFQISDGIQVVGLGILRGMEDVKIPTLLTLFAYLVIALPTCYLLGIYFGFGIKGIWIGLLLGLSLSALLMMIRFRMLTQKKLKLTPIV